MPSRRRNKYLLPIPYASLSTGTGPGATDHGALTGLADDDHTQYHTDARGDARYSLLAHTHAGVYAALSHTHAISDVTGLQTALDGKASTGHTHSYEPSLGNPDVDGKVLSSTAAGVRSWIAAGAASDHGTLTGLGDDDHTQYHNDTRGDARYGQLSAANTWTNNQSITGNLTLTSTAADDLPGPVLTLHRNSASPASVDLLGRIIFTGKDDAGNDHTYASILGYLDDPTNASEDSRLYIQTSVAGTHASRGYFGNGLVMGSATGGDQGAGTVNAQALYVNGTAVAASPWTVVTATADQLVTNSAVLADSTYLQFTTVANTNYHIRLRVLFNSGNATADIKYRVTHAGTTTRVRRVRTYSVPNGTSATFPTVLPATAFDSADQTLLATVTGDSVVYEDIYLQVGASGGVFKIAFAQNTQTAAASVTLYEGSYLEYMTT